jgi:hypothetical protein
MIRHRNIQPIVFLESNALFCHIYTEFNMLKKGTFSTEVWSKWREKRCRPKFSWSAKCNRKPKPILCSLGSDAQAEGGRMLHFIGSAWFDLLDMAHRLVLLNEFHQLTSTNSEKAHWPVMFSWINWVEQFSFRDECPRLTWPIKR